MKLEFKRLTLEKWAALVTIIGFPLLLISLYVAAHQDVVIITSVDKLSKIAQSQNNIALAQMFFGDAGNLGIIEAVENKKPILNANGGQFSNTRLDKYLGDLETIYDVYDEKLLSENELCGTFSVYAQEAEANPEIKEYLKKNAQYFSGLPKLFDIVDHSQNENCRD